jgi:ubiquinone/menaquinone biosynthesis C-methylase UbiE
MGDYDNFAEKYAEKTAQMEKESRDYYHTLLPSGLKGMKILDVGCGSGQDAVYYAKLGAEVYGIDVSKKEIEMAQKRDLGKFKVGDMKKLPYKSDSFDCVTSYYALQASDKIQQTLAEITRVTKSGGIILIQTKHPFRNFIEGWKNDGKLNYYNPGNVTSNIFNKAIVLSEPSHTMTEYFSPKILNQIDLILFEEHSDFPASEEIIKNLVYPTYMILKFRKK